MAINKKLLPLLSLPLLAGCATWQIPTAEAPVSAPAFSNRFPMKVGVLIKDEDLVLSHTEKTEGCPTKYTVSLPFGWFLKETAEKSLPDVFESVEIVKGEPYPEHLQAILVPEPGGLNWDYGLRRGLGAGRNNPCAIADFIVPLRLTLLGMDGAMITQRPSEIKVPVRRGLLAGTASDEKLRAVGEQFFKATADAFTGISTWQELRGALARRPAAPSRPAAAPSVRSDVDTPPSVRMKPDKRSTAVVIGIENYRQKLPRADYAAHDARTVEKYLTQVLGYPEENVVTLLDDHASMSDLTKYFERWLPNNAEEGGRVFVYYSGHGAPNPKTGDAYLVPYDGDPTYIESTGYSLKRLYRQLSKLKSKEVVVALDACFSGAGGRSVLAEGARPLVVRFDEKLAPPKGAVVLAAASGEQISSTYKEKGHGLFTYFFLKGLQGAGDLNEDGRLELSEVYSYLKPRVEKTARRKYNNEQTPEMTYLQRRRIFLRP